MRLELSLHPDSICTAVSRIGVDAARTGPRALELSYHVVGEAAGLQMPAPAEPLRTDDLWRRTCFEAFIRTARGEAYYEFNLSPSTRWAAYRFSSYRDGGSDIDVATPPRIGMHPSGDGFSLKAVVDLSGLPDLPDGPWTIGLSAVIEEADGGKSYWALAHTPGKADFHHPDCFAGQLPAPGRP